MSSTYLDGILAWHRARAAGDRRDLEDLRGRALAYEVPTRPFEKCLRTRTAVSLAPSATTPAVIAEVKRRSPSKGDLAIDLDAAQVAVDYQKGGASALSVLTDAPHFAGSPEDLTAARAATTLPVLRKDFTVCEADICDARLMNADAVLLIVAALSDEQLARFLALTRALAMAGLVEVHDVSQARRAVAAGATIIGVNQRDLRTFEVDRARAEMVAASLPADVVKVAESGIRSRAEVVRLGEAGYDAVLVGETLVRDPDRAGAVAALLGVVVPGLSGVRG
jgi:indole-3-glycerol phosphate synthase